MYYNILKNDVRNYCKNGIKIMEITSNMFKIASRIIQVYIM